MSSILLTFLGIQLLFALPGVVGTWKVRRALQKEQMKQDADGDRFEGYLRFLATSRSIQQTNNRNSATMILILIIVVLCAMVFLGFTVHYSSFQAFQVAQIIVLAFLIGILVSTFITSIPLFWLNSKAWHLFQSTDAFPLLTNSSRHFIAATVKVLILILSCEALATVIIQGGNLFLAFLLFGFVIAVVTLFWTSLVLLRFDRSLPVLEQTPWSALAPRITAWAQLAGVTFRAVYIQPEMIGPVGCRIWLSLSNRQHPSLVLSAAFLQQSEWRQQDALFASAACSARLLQSQHALLRELLRFLVLWASITLIPFLQIWLPPIMAPFVLYVQILLLMISAIIVASLRPFSPRLLFLIDRLTALLTGDPLAVIVAMHLVEKLSWRSLTNTTSASSKQMRQRALSRQWSLLPPSTQQRMLEVTNVMRQEWSRAPQAGEPVPAMITVLAGPHLLTAPFDQATEATPVPSSAYGGNDLFTGSANETVSA